MIWSLPFLSTSTLLSTRETLLFKADMCARVVVSWRNMSAVRPWAIGSATMFTLVRKKPLSLLTSFPNCTLSDGKLKPQRFRMLKIWQLKKAKHKIWIRVSDGRKWQSLCWLKGGHRLQAALWKADRSEGGRECHWNTGARRNWKGVTRCARGKGLHWYREARQQKQGQAGLDHSWLERWTRRRPNVQPRLLLLRKLRLRRGQWGMGR